MTPAPPPAHESARLRDLLELQVLDTAPEREYDDLVYLASQICGTPIATLSLIDSHRQWLKARVGRIAQETPREFAFCPHVICAGTDVMVVPDAAADARFADNPLVTGDPNIRFYAGSPLITPRGSAIGTLCVIDHVPREIRPDQRHALEALGRQAAALLELRRAKHAADELLAQLRTEQAKSDRLLHSLFPAAIAERLRTEAPSCIAQEHPGVTILFADVSNFGMLAAGRSPTEVVNLLNHVFSMFDRLAEAHGVEKIKTIGDAYMAVAGLATPRPNHARAAADLALAIQRELAVLRTGSREPFSVRIGLHSGPVVAGVIGIQRLAYDLWGPTVKLAAQMEALGVPGGVQVSAATHELLADDYLFEKRGEFYVKGEGEVTTYLLRGRRGR